HAQGLISLMKAQEVDSLLGDHGVGLFSDESADDLLGVVQASDEFIVGEGNFDHPAAPVPFNPNAESTRSGSSSVPVTRAGVPEVKIKTAGVSNTRCSRALRWFVSTSTTSTSARPGRWLSQMRVRLARAACELRSSPAMKSTIRTRSLGPGL